MKNKIITVAFILMLALGLVLTLALPEKKISSLERRKLASSETLKEDFTANLDEYLSDQFVLRDAFLAIGTSYDRYILKNKEANDVYMSKDFIIEKNYPYNEKGVQAFIDKIKYFAEKTDRESRVFYSIIPDKSYYLDDSKALKMDFEALVQKVNSGLDIDYIDIIHRFKLEDYFKTDIHLKQDSYLKIVDEYIDKFGLDRQHIDYKRHTLNHFYGASFSKAPFSKPEDIEYLTDEIIANAKVTHLEYGTREVYDFEANREVDLYNVFLSGPSAILEIENPLSTNERELVVFRDSFASSLAPLLIPYYKKITLVDLRYINAKNVEARMDLKDKDVLFLYSTLIINRGNILK